MAISLRELKGRVNVAEHFEFAGYEGETIVMHRKVTHLEKHAAWLRKHQWPARIVIVIGEIAVVAVIFVFGILIGAGL